MPPMLSSRQWPQTLLLTVLSLLIAAATLMLACAPAAAPAPADGDIFSAAQPGAGGSAEPAAKPEKPTATPQPEPTDTPMPYPTQCIVMPRDFQHLEEAEFKEGANPPGAPGWPAFAMRSSYAYATPAYAQISAFGRSAQPVCSRS